MLIVLHVVIKCLKDPELITDMFTMRPPVPSAIPTKEEADRAFRRAMRDPGLRESYRKAQRFIARERALNKSANPSAEIIDNF